MKQIWKYFLEVTEKQEIVMPAGAEFLTVQVQRDIPYIWVCVNPDNELETRQIRIHGTGHNINDCENFKYISTFQMHDGSLIFHAFEDIQ